MSMVDELKLEEEARKKESLNVGDMIVLVLDAVLLGFTIYRSWHFLDNSISADWKIVAILGLWGLDIGATVWSIVWMFASSNRYQDWTSIGMFLVDLVGMILTSLIDSLVYARSGTVAVPPIMQEGAQYAIPIIIILNVVAGFLYHMISDRTALMREERQARSDLRRAYQRHEIQSKRKLLDIKQLKEFINAREAQLAQEQDLVAQMLHLDAIEKGLRQARESRDLVDAAAKDTERRITGTFQRRSARPDLEEVGAKAEAAPVMPVPSRNGHNHRDRGMGAETALPNA
jgi:hypothetical protein